MSKNLTNSINQRSSKKIQNPMKTKTRTENECVNEVQKIPEQNFGAYEDICCYNRPHFCPFYRYLNRVVRFISNTSLYYCNAPKLC